MGMFGGGDGPRGKSTPSKPVESKPKKVAAAPQPSNPGMGVSAADWQLVQQVAKQHGIDPYVLVAIGEHETQWGQTGLGRKGLILGVGADNHNPSFQYAGLKGQLEQGAAILNRFGVKTIQDIADGKATTLLGKGKAWAQDDQGNPSTSWGPEVVQLYNHIKGTNFTATASTAQGAPGAQDLSGHNTPLSMDDLAKEFGFAKDFFTSDPSLSKILNDFQGQNPGDPNVMKRFQGELMNTPWYQSHSVAQRQWISTQQSDPAEAKAKMWHTENMVTSQAANLGVSLNPKLVTQLANEVLTLGLSTDGSNNELQYVLGKKLQESKTGAYKGLAAQTYNQLEKNAGDYGLQYNPDQTFKWMRGVVEGRDTTDTALEQMKIAAKSKYEGFAQGIDQGQTVREQADPYVQQQARLLEVAPDSINLGTDKLLNQSLQYRDPTVKAGQPQKPEPLWQAEQRVKQDSRWLSTDNGKNDIIGFGSAVLQNMGQVAKS